MRLLSPHFSFFLLYSLMLSLLSCNEDENVGNLYHKEQLPLDIHVVLIGLDGWGAYSLTMADMPNIKMLMNNGAYTLHKRSVLPSSSADNWASLYMVAPPEIHGYLNWDSRISEINNDIPLKNNIFPTIFQVLKEQRPECTSSLFFSWEGIKYLVDTLSIDDVVYIPYNDGKNDVVFNSVVREHILLKKPTFCHVYYSEPDVTGHYYGFLSSEYLEMLNKLDNYVGEIVEDVKEAGFYEKTIFIITSDHGGIDYKHGGISLNELESPLIFCGPYIKKGEINKMIMQYEIGATIAWILGLNFPTLWVGRPMVELFIN